MNDQAIEQETSTEMLSVDDLDHFVALMSDWHNHQVATVKHLYSVPEGIKIIIGDGDDAEEKTLEGEMLAGFQLGIDLALNYLGKLPFVAEYGDVPPESAQH